MGFYGADTEQLREHAEAVRLGEQSLAELFESLDSVVRTVSWNGPDAEGFRSQWGSLISGSARDVCDSLRRRSEEADREADEQDGASQEEGGTGLPWGPLPTPWDGVLRSLKEDTSQESDGFFGDLLGGPESGYHGSLLWNIRSIGVDAMGFVPDPTGITNILQLPDDIANVNIGLYDASQSFQDGDLFGTMDGLITAGINGADAAFNVIGAIPTPVTKVVGEFGGMITGGLDMQWSAATAAAQGSAIAGGPGEGSTTRFLVETPFALFDQVTGTTMGGDLIGTATETADSNYARLTESVRENVPFIDPVLDAQQEAVQAGADHLWGDAVEGTATRVNDGVRDIVDLFT